MGHICYTRENKEYWWRTIKGNIGRINRRQWFSEEYL